MEKDAILVLGGGINEDGSLPLTPQLRAEKGAQLYHEGVSENVICSTKWYMLYKFTPPKTEAQALADHMHIHGVPLDQILLEESSKDTIGNIYFTKTQILEPRGWKDLAIISSHYHEKRVRYLCKKILGPEYSIEFFGSADGMGMHDKRMTRQDPILLCTQFIFRGIKDGDHEAIGKKLRTLHPAYATNPPWYMRKIINALNPHKLDGHED